MGFNDIKDVVICVFLNYFRLCLWIIVIFILYYAYINRRTVRLIEKLPALKLKCWHILGHTRITDGRMWTTRKGDYSFHVYDFQQMVGYAKLFENEGICKVWQANSPSIMVYRADTVKAILNHSTELKKAWMYKFLHNWLGTGLLTSEGEKWKQRRKLLTPTFHFDILKDFLPGLNSQSEIFVAVLKKELEKSWIDVVPFITRCSLDIICETTLGVKIASQTTAELKYVKAVLRLSESVLRRCFAPWLWPDIIFRNSGYGRRLLDDIETVHKFTREVISQKKREKQTENQKENTKVEGEEDSVYRHRKKRALLDFLIEEHINNKTITEEDIREEVDTFTFEGHDTTSMGMSWAVYLVGLYPEIQEKLQDELKSIFGEDQERPTTMEDLAEMKYLESVIKETQRLCPSVSYFARDLIEDLEIGNYTVPKGTTCGIFSYFLHRDPAVFPNPEKFDPDRFFPGCCESRDAFAYIPFSAGPRNCIGQRFAMMEQKTVLASLFRNFQVQSIDQRDRVHVVNNVILRAEGPIRIKLTNRVF